MGLWIVTTRVLYFIHGPVTVAAERGGLLIRWLCPSQVRILSGPLCACTPMAEGTRRERVQCSFESSQAHQISSVAEIVPDSHARLFCAVMHRVRQLDCLSSETLWKTGAEQFQCKHHRAYKTGWIKILFDGAAQLARDALLD